MSCEQCADMARRLERYRLALEEIAKTAGHDYYLEDLGDIAREALKE
jgi:hypothetical protein